MVLVVLCAGTFGSLRLFGPHPALDWGFFLFQTIALPLVWTATVVLLLPPGPYKDWTIRAILLMPVGIILAIIGRVELAIVFRAEDPFDLLVFILMLCVVNLGLFWWLIPVFRGLIPKRCPRCNRYSMLRDRSGDHFDRISPKNTHWCRRCGGQFRRWVGDRWQELERPTPKSV